MVLDEGERRHASRAASGAASSGGGGPDRVSSHEENTGKASGASRADGAFFLWGRTGAKAPVQTGDVASVFCPFCVKNRHLMRYDA